MSNTSKAIFALGLVAFAAACAPKQPEPVYVAPAPVQAEPVYQKY